LIQEYDQRDRDFLMHVTMNAGLFGAAGFLLHELKSSTPWGNVLIGNATPATSDSAAQTGIGGTSLGASPQAASFDAGY
jgi:hypothetical protein